MTTIYEKVEAALDTLGVPYGMSTYLSDAELPDVYLVYSMISGVGTLHADDGEMERAYRIQLSIYSRSGLVGLPNVDAAMLAAGFTKGPERDLPFDPETGHFGLGKDYFRQGE